MSTTKKFDPISHHALGKLHPTQHAMSRFAERAAGDFSERLKRSVQFGAQRGSSTLLRDDDIVFTVTREDDGTQVITTVLSLEHAVANMQGAGIAMASGCIKRTPATREPLASIAARHVLAGSGKKTRNADLRDAGYDPSGSAGELYRAAFEGAQAMRELLAEQCSPITLGVAR